jgi:choline dehydrogenase-like flavoprotein
MREDTNFDAIIIGSGAGGAAAAFALVQAGQRVLLLERGETLPRDGRTLDVARVVAQGEFLAREPWVDGVGKVFAPEEHFNLGGKTKWYGAALFRFNEAEFRPDPAFQCPAWPIRLEDLAPFYTEAERLLGVRPMTAEPDLAWIIGRMQRSGSGWQAASMPMGLAPDITRYPREAAHFDGFASVQDLKGEAESRLLSRLRDAPNLRIVTGVEVTALIGSAADPRCVVGVEASDGGVWRGRHIILAAGALHSPRLLQRYLDDAGLGQTLPATASVGRYLKLHLLTAMVAFSWRPMTDLVRKTMVLTHPRFPHSTVQPLGFDAELIATLIPRWVPRVVARFLARRAYGFFLQTEDGSHPENAVRERQRDNARERVMDYRAARSAPAAREHRRFTRALQWGLLRAGLPSATRRIGLAGTAHACGTLAAGTDPAHSVVDATGRVHGMCGLYVADGSVLTRISRVNPALTIYAWGMRLGTLLAGGAAPPVAAAAGEQEDATC